MNLLIDIGNTMTHVAVAGKTRILSEFRVETHERHSFHLVMNKLGRYKMKIQSAAISSVVPSRDEFWQNFVIRTFGFKPLAVSGRSFLPITIRIEKARTLGADRICNAVYGYLAFKKRQNVIIIDLGTATTYDVILKNGDFMGGVISAGIETSARALHSKTGKLPLLSYSQFKFPRRVTGKNTLNAIQSGLMYSASITIDGMIKQISKDYGRKFKIVLTGGLAKTVYRKINTKAKLETNTVLKGLNYILNYNNLV